MWRARAFAYVAAGDMRAVSRALKKLLERESGSALRKSC
jgi:hypothetical protein